MSHFDVIIGSNSGVLKGANLLENSYHNLNFSPDLEKSFEPVSLCWNTPSSSSDEKWIEFLSASQNRSIHLFNLHDRSKNRQFFECTEGTGNIKGLEIVKNNILTCVESGEVRLRSIDGEDQKVGFSAGANIFKMRVSPCNQNLMVTGGKENALKIWDLNSQNDTKTPIFTAKNVKNDWLNLRVSVWETDFRFMQNDELIATCTGNHLVRLYDRRGDRRRPVLQIDGADHPLTTLALKNHDRQVIVGSSRGYMAAFDLRATGKLLYTYKGFAGSITAMETHASQPYVATCSLDRFVRVHHTETRKLLHKIYCKAPLGTLLLNEELSIACQNNDSGKGNESDDLEDVKCENDDEDVKVEKDDTDDDVVWDTLRNVEDKTKRKRHTGRKMKKVKTEPEQ